ncbi:MAG TPA: toll/interleukin-1 receptor domain-containing protein [Actinophytocola sp.]|jgi:WD40 repeat protein|nr:toll/interleukin-1 receptor domain-containing protein [Actinophytocola sp.]
MAVEGGYDSFISYSHATDRGTAKALQRTLHRLGRRWYRRTALRVFRDDTTLAASPDLWGSIESALGSARTFVLLACPESAASPWVGKEVEFWRRERSRDTFLIALTGGELCWDPEAGDFDPERSDALPAQLRGWFDSEPFWVDLRGHREGKRQREFRERSAAIAAAVHDQPKDALLSEDAQQQRRLVTVLSALLVLAVAAGAVAVWQLNTAIAERERADEQARVALSRALAGESGAQLETDPRLATQLALAAYGADRTSEARGAVLRALDRNRHVLAYVRRGTDQVSTQRFASNLTPTHVALSPDGATLAFAHLLDTSVTLWDVRGSRVLAKLHVDPPPGTPADEYSASSGLAFSADGRMLAVNDGARVQIWDVPDRRLVRMIDGAGGESDLVLSPNGRLVTRVGDPRFDEAPLRMWRTDTGEELTVPAPPGYLQSAALAFDSAGRRLYAQLTNGMYRLDLGTGRWSRVFPFAARRPHAFALSGRPDRLVFATDTALELWDPATGRRLQRRAVAGIRNIGLRSASLSEDGAKMAFDDGTGRLLAMDLATGRTTELARLRVPAADVAMSADGRVVAAISDDGDAVLATPGTDHRLLADAPAPDHGTGKDAEPRRKVAKTAIGARGDLAVVGRGGGAEIWELPGLRMRARVELPGTSTVDGVAISPDQKRLAVLAGSRLVLADTRTGRVSSTINLARPSSTAPARSDGVRFLPDNRSVVVDADGGPLVVDTRSRQRLQQLSAEGGNGFVTSADAGLVAVVEKSLTARAGGIRIGVWRRVGSRYEKVGLLHQPVGARDVELSPDGARLAIADGDGRVVTMELRDVDDVGVLRNTTTSGSGEIAFAADGATLVQGSAGISLLDVADERQLAVWPDESPVAGAAPEDAGMATLEVGANGWALASRSDGSLTVWQVRVDKAIPALCDLAGELSEEDSARYVRGVEIPSVCE